MTCSEFFFLTLTALQDRFQRIERQEKIFRLLQIGGPSRAQWEDVTGSTPLTFVNDCVSFTTTVRNYLCGYNVC